MRRQQRNAKTECTQIGEVEGAHEKTEEGGYGGWLRGGGRSFALFQLVEKLFASQLLVLHFIFKVAVNDDVSVHTN